MAYFEYPVPMSQELRGMIDAPYRFSKELRDQVDYIFSHPTLNDLGKFYAKHRRDFISNDMLKPAYRVVLYFMQNPNQFAGAIDNILDDIAVKMWKIFINFAKLEDDNFGYKRTPMKVMKLMKGKFMDMLLDEIRNKKYVMHPNELLRVENPKDRYSVDKLRLNRDNHCAAAKMPLDEGDDYFEYLCTLD